MAQRKKISAKLRFSIFKRDLFRCQYCGRTPPDTVLEVDHFHPVSAGGDNSDENLITSCFDCNRGKGAEDVTAPPDTIAEKLRKQQEIQEQVKQYNQFLMELRRDVDVAIIRIGENWYDRFTEEGEYIFGDARSNSVRMFLKRLTEAEILDAIDVAHNRLPPQVFNNGFDDQSTWKYFCGVCWKRIRGEGK